MIASRFLALACLVSLAACAAGPAPRDTPGPAADDNLNAVVWMQNSEEFALSALTVYRAAGALLDQALADPAWDAMAPGEREGDRTGLPPAIIVDVDETILDNSAYQARLVLEGREYDTGSWAEWVEEARATPVPGAVEFLSAAAGQGVTVFYITNREHGQAEATLANLAAVGFPVAQGVPVHLGLGMPVEGCTDQGQNKVCRRQWVAERYRVLMQFGDQLSDFIDIGDNSPASRAQAMASAGGYIGERWFMLPNPTYGYWESSLFGEDWSLSRDERRRIKRGSLRTH